MLHPTRHRVVLTAARCQWSDELQNASSLCRQGLLQLVRQSGKFVEVKFLLPSHLEGTRFALQCTPVEIGGVSVLRMRENARQAAGTGRLKDRSMCSVWTTFGTNQYPSVWELSRFLL